MGNTDGFIETLIGFGVLIGLCVWGLFSVYDYYFVFDGIKSKTKIIPKIELIIENGKVDTLYIYEQTNGGNK